MTVSDYVLIFVVVCVLYLYYDVFFTSSSTSTVTSTPANNTITTLTSTITQDNTTVSSVATPTYQVVITSSPRSEFNLTTTIMPKTANVVCTISIKPGNGFTYANMNRYQITMTSLIAATGTACTPVYGPLVNPLASDATGFTVTFLSNSTFAHTLMLSLVTSA